MTQNNKDRIFQKEEENDQCLSKGICSISPSLSFLHEVIKSYLKELAFYLLKLRELGVNNEKIKENVIDIISGLIVNVDYDEEQFSKVHALLYSNLTQAKNLYFSLCNKNNLKAELLSSKLKNPESYSLSDAIQQGQALIKIKNNTYTIKQKKLFELNYIIIKSICTHLVELKELDVDNDEAYGALLSLLNIMNSFVVTEEKLKEEIKKIVELDHDSLRKLQDIREERYGEIVPTEVSLSTRPNKAILVTGTNLRELELVLEATKDRGIDVYTHGHMIMAHSFPKLRAYPNLVGHYGKGVDTYLIDFAAFPGVIFMTRHSFQRVEKLYRSSVFTTDLIAPKGVITIKNNNFEPLIQSALWAKGFTKTEDKGFVTIDLHEKKILQKITEVAEKIEKGEIKHFFVIGRTSNMRSQGEYFKKFLDLVGDDSFVLSFSYTKNSKNVLLVQSEYVFHLIYKILRILTRKITITDLDPVVLYTRCDALTLPNLLHTKFMGVNKIYACDCSPNVVNPSIVEAIREMYDIKKFTNPKNDLKEMLSKQG